MSQSVALFEGRNVVRFVLVGILGGWLSGCSTDASRFGDAGKDPFANPFGLASNTAPTSTPSVASQPLPGNVDTAYAVPAKPSPYRAGNPPASPPVVYTGSIPAANPQPVSGSASGWSAVGGTPVVVAEGESLDTLSRRYGVPTQALLGANGLKSPSQVHPGMRVIVPVYNARNVTAAQPIPTATEPKKRHGLDAAKADSSDDEDTTPAKAKPKVKKTADSGDDADAPVKTKAKKAVVVDDTDSNAAPAKAKAAPVKDKPEAAKDKPATAKDKTALVKPEKPPVKRDPKVAMADAKAPSVNVTTGRTAPETTTPPETSSDADKQGAAPEFRWPARGRIIQGFKDSGNDGINISVPEGTSVRAAESGVVAYAGNALKGYGNLVLIKHPNGFVTAYANNGELSVKRGESVKRGQVIAKSGDSGNVTAPQLHFELRNKAGAPVDPTAYLAGI